MRPIYEEIWMDATPLCRWTICIPFILVVYTMLALFLPVIIPVAYVCKWTFPLVDVVTSTIHRAFWRTKP